MAREDIIKWGAGLGAEITACYCRSNTSPLQICVQRALADLRQITQQQAISSPLRPLDKKDALLQCPPATIGETKHRRDDEEPQENDKWNNEDTAQESGFFVSLSSN